jgi:hypothetical protein
MKSQNPLSALVSTRKDMPDPSYDDVPIIKGGCDSRSNLDRKDSDRQSH